MFKNLLCILSLQIITYCQQIENLRFDTIDIVETIEGMADGFGTAVSSSFETCLKEDEAIYSDVQDFVTESQKGTIAGDVAAAKILYKLSQEVIPALTTCKVAYADIVQVTQILSSFTSAKEFFQHLEKDAEENQDQLTTDVESAVINLESQNYYEMGQNLGDMFEKVLVGKQQRLYTINTDAVVKILEGVIMGFGAALSGDFSSCVNDAEKVFFLVESAVQDFEAETPSKILDGLKLLAQVVQEIPELINECKCVVNDIEKLLAAAKTLSSPMSFVYHVGQDIIINRVQIYGDIKMCITDYRSQQYYEFGVSLGNALEKLLVGVQQEQTFLQ